VFGKHVFPSHLGTVGQSLFSVTRVKIPNNSFDIEMCVSLCVRLVLQQRERY